MNKAIFLTMISTCLFLTNQGGREGAGCPGDSVLLGITGLNAGTLIPLWLLRDSGSRSPKSDPVVASLETAVQLEITALHGGDSEILGQLLDSPAGLPGTQPPAE